MNRCTKPDQKGTSPVPFHPVSASLASRVEGRGKSDVSLTGRAEYLQICRAVAIGFAIMGGIGYIVKLIHIPINQILVGGA